MQTVLDKGGAQSVVMVKDMEFNGKELKSSLVLITLTQMESCILTAYILSSCLLQV